VSKKKQVAKGWVLVTLFGIARIILYQNWRYSLCLSNRQKYQQKNWWSVILPVIPQWCEVSTLAIRNKTLRVSEDRRTGNTTSSLVPYIYYYYYYCSILLTGKRIFSLQKRSDRLWGLSSILLGGYQGLSRGKASGAWTYLPPSTAQFKNERSCISIFVYEFTEWTGTTITRYIIIIIIKDT